MKNQFIILFLNIVIWCTASAQEYHDAALLEAYGPVKKLTYDKVKKAVKKSTYSYTDNGRSELSLMTYDDDGFPVNADISLGSLKDVTNITWNNNRTVSVVENFTQGLGSRGFTIEYTYPDEEKAPSSQIINYWKPIDKGESKKVFCKEEYTYSGYEYDSRGNWIARNVSLAITNYGKKTKTSTKEYHQTRSISYY